MASSVDALYEVNGTGGSDWQGVGANYSVMRQINTQPLSNRKISSAMYIYRCRMHAATQLRRGLARTGAHRRGVVEGKELCGRGSARTYKYVCTLCLISSTYSTPPALPSTPKLEHTTSRTL